MNFKHTDTDLCEKHGLDPKRVESIARRISRAAKEAEEMGLTVFGGPGTGHLFYYMGKEDLFENKAVAELKGSFDGGDPYGSVL